MNKRKIFFQLALSALISLVIIGGFLKYLATKGQSVNIGKFVELIKEVSLPLLVIYVLIMLLGTWFRSLRFRTLIEAAGTEVVPSPKDMYIITMVRNMVVDLLPSRTGELIYIAMLKKRHNVSTAVGTSSLGMSIWFDLFILSLMIIGIAILGSIVPSLAIHTELKWLVLIIVIIACLPLGLIVAHKLLERFPQIKSRFLNNKVGRWFEALIESSRMGLSRQYFWKTSALSVGVRFCKYLGMYLLFMAVSDSVSAAFIDISPTNILWTLIASEFTASLPIPALMSFGTYEAGGVFSLTQLGVPTFIAAAVIFSTHLLSQIVDYTLGGIGLMLYSSQAISDDKQTAQAKFNLRKWLKFAFFIPLFAVALWWAHDKYQDYKFAKTLTPPDAGQPVSHAKDLSTTASENLANIGFVNGKTGFIIWSSNRYGNHDILKLNLPDMSIERLTDHDHTEGYPSISPDGSKVVFARAHIPWLSWRNFTDWDTYLLDLESGEERLLAKNAYQATWDQNGEDVYYIGDGGRNIRGININSAEDSLMFEGGSGDWPYKMALYTPSFNEATQEFALNYRKPMPSTGFVNINQPDKMIDVSRNSCQISWSADNDFAYYVGDGRDKNAFYKYDPQTQKSEVWLDLPGEYSHEYFPRLSQTQEYLVFAASAGGHEHDTEDYELFLWRVGDPAEDAARLSFHTGNDNWPDVFINQ